MFPVPGKAGCFEEVDETRYEEGAEGQYQREKNDEIGSIEKGKGSDEDTEVVVKEIESDEGSTYRAEV